MKEEAAWLVDKTGQDLQKLGLQGWRLCHDSPVSTFQKRWVAVLQGEHTYVFRRTDGEPHSNAASERTFYMGNNIGNVVSVIPSQCINVS